MKIDNHNIGLSHPPYIVAELSANHSGSIEIAKRAIKGAKESGASAVKLQTYTPSTMTLDVEREEYLIHAGPWAGRRLFELYLEAHTPYEWHEELFQFAAEIGITVFSTPFDESAVDLLETLGCPAYKIASFELQDIHLIRYAASTGKPLIISTGMGSFQEIGDAVTEVRNYSEINPILLHCTSSYPAPIQDSNLLKIPQLRSDFSVDVGLSDHTLGFSAALGAIALGAVVIEKHFSLDSEIQSVDSAFSMSVDNLQHLVQMAHDVWSARGTASYIRPESEKNSLIFRRSLIFADDLPKGTVIQHHHIVRRRPGFGLPPNKMQEVIGRILSRNVERGQPVTVECVE